jgi:uncharacterized membrane protein HdeD (DUF308 family)
MKPFLIGGIAIAAWVIALIFFRFHRETRDRFFALFGWAFVIEGANRIPEAFAAPGAEDSPLVYVVRLAGYLLILYAIWDKNRTNS